MPDAKWVEVEIETEEGGFRVGIDAARAPLTASNFLAYLDAGFLDSATVYRIVTLANQPADTAHKIEVIQWGWGVPGDGREPPFPPVPHEPTSMTGLRHLDGTVSLARREPGSGGQGFFICIGDQPELDEGGGRNPDRAGFAAFGRVLAGADVVRRIFGRAEVAEYLERPVRILQARRLG